MDGWMGGKDERIGEERGARTGRWKTGGTEGKNHLFTYQILRTLPPIQGRSCRCLVIDTRALALILDLSRKTHVPV